MEVSKHKVVGKEKKKWFTRSKREELKEELIGYGFVLPQLILFIMFIAYPVLEGFKMSLFQQTYVDEVFVGFENYRQLFSDPVFIKSSKQNCKSGRINDKILLLSVLMVPRKSSCQT